MSEPVLSSTHNPRIKEAAALRERKHRDREGMILIDGWRELTRAVTGEVVLRAIFLPVELPVSPVEQQQLNQLADLGVRQYRCLPAAFSRVAYGHRQNEPVAVAVRPARRLIDLPLSACPLIGVLEGVEKPGNVGAVLRSADGAGLDGVIVANPGTDLYNPNTIRASLGTVFTLPVCVAPVSDTLDYLRNHVQQICVARVDGAIPYPQCDFRLATALVLGSESEGLSQTWVGPDLVAVRLPMRGAADSLNVAAAAAVLFYEALRQRNVSER